jgi:hypothetical protein
MDYQIIDRQPKRVREPKARMQWVHSMMGLKGELKQCLYGLHSVGDCETVYIVESEKTAIIMKAAMPEIAVIATGGVGNLNSVLMMPIAKKRVRLLPDADLYMKWRIEAEESAYFMRDIAVLDWGIAKVGYGGDPADLILQGELPDLFEPEANDPFEGLAPKKKMKTKLDRMIERNPALQSMIDRLDLVEI